MRGASLVTAGTCSALNPHEHRCETRFYPVQIRYAWPSELDLMARLAGLRLRQRWGGWRRESFTASSTSHVSVYKR
jgi:hypothetical protein